MSMLHTFTIPCQLEIIKIGLNRLLPWQQNKMTKATHKNEYSMCDSLTYTFTGGRKFMYCGETPWTVVRSMGADRSLVKIAMCNANCPLESKKQLKTKLNEFFEDIHFLFFRPTGTKRLRTDTPLPFLCVENCDLCWNCDMGWPVPASEWVLNCDDG